MVQLPFITRNSDGRTTSTWEVSSSGDYDQDCVAGRRYFELMLQQCPENPILPMRVIEGMIAKGETGGVEIGFLTALSEHIA